MAERTVTVCDLDDRAGTFVAATAHIRVDLDGEVRELDVCSAHLAEIRRAVEAALGLGQGTARRTRTRKTAASGAAASRTRPARKTAKKAAASRTRRRTSSRRTSPARSRQSGEEVREWARSQGIEVKERGRLSKTLLEQYAAATSA
jgi:hypothetical protein